MNVIELAFPVHPVEVPQDHGYALFGALARAVPALHDVRWLAVHPLSGRPLGKNRLTLGGTHPLRMRLPTEHVGTLLGLAGAELEVAGSRLVLGAPTVHPLVPASCLDARLVVVKLTQVPTRSRAEVGGESIDPAALQAGVERELNRQLERLGIRSNAQLKGRQRISVGGKRVIGFSVRVDALSADASLALQALGLGGKRKMGCGVFRATRGA
jgi:CRISPR-associated protein Cas6